jgi:hypothetical protein
MQSFNFYDNRVQQFSAFRELLLYLHSTYFVAFVSIKNNEVYLADKRVGVVDAIPNDYKD